MNTDTMHEKKQRAVEQIVSEVEERHRLRIHEKIRLTRTEINTETFEFMQRLAAAAMKRACELQVELERIENEVRERGPKAR